ncbi:hypothetical protein GGI20_000091 [Coemansia sp. BCRC 34301]|nr:hypothetical protein GGI20_000091 [Coemansia sp. BCRC 34301]
MVLLSGWIRSAAKLLTVLCCVTGATAADDDGTNAHPAKINPMGVTFDYKLAWVNVQTSTFGVSMQAKAQPTYNGTAWSLLLRYDPSAMANIVQISDGWGLGIYDHSSWALFPSKDPFGTMYFTVHSSGQMSLEDTVLKLAEPASFFLVSSAGNSFSSGFELRKDSDYTINQSVNLAKIPKEPFGSWLSLSRVPPGSLMTFAPSHRPTETPTANNSGAISVIKTGDATVASPTSTETFSPTPTPTSTDTSSAVDAASSTILPPAKYIPGDANYDRSVNPLGTELAGPKTGLYLVSTILGIGIIAHALGTIRRYQYRRQYHLSVSRSKAGSLLA